MRLNNVIVIPCIVCCVTLAGSVTAVKTGLADEPKPIVADGASFVEPKGWVRLTSDKPKTKGWFLSADSDRKSPKAMIMVDIGTPTDPSLQAMAEKTARNWGGKVLDQKTTLDGVEAFQIRVEKPGKGLRPVEGIVAINDGQLYLLMGGSTPGTSVIDPVEEVRKAWRWVK